MDSNQSTYNYDQRNDVKNLPPPAYTDEFPTMNVPYSLTAGAQVTTGKAQSAQPSILIMQPGYEYVRESYCGHIVLSCFVFWCCGWICGLAAFILACMKVLLYLLC